MFFLGIDAKSGKEVLAKITREAYLTDNLAAKLLISIDVIVPENINIMISKKAGHIGSYSTNIVVKVSQKKGVPKSLVYVIAGLTIPAFTSIAIPIHHSAAIEDRDLLFEPDETPVTLFVQLANKDIKTVLARNDSGKPVFLPRNFRLGNLMDIEYDSGFPVLNADVTDLAARFPKNSIPKNSTIKIPQSHCEDSEMETKHYTGATIYGDAETAGMFSDLLDEFPENLFNDIGFVDLPEDRWMKIDLRPD
jgi:hypothetical protein